MARMARHSRNLPDEKEAPVLSEAQYARSELADTKGARRASVDTNTGTCIVNVFQHFSPNHPRAELWSEKK
jgi:hypothetical protein